MFEAMYPIVVALTQLQELVDDTCLAAGSEAYAAALQVYNYAKAIAFFIQQLTQFFNDVDEIGCNFLLIVTVRPQESG